MTLLNFDSQDKSVLDTRSVIDKPITGVQENFEAAFKGSFAQAPFAKRFYERDWWGSVVDEINAQTGQDFDNPMYYFTRNDREAQKIQKYVRDNLDKLEGDFNIFLQDDLAGSIEQQTRERALANIEEMNEVFSRAEGFLPTAASYAGMFSAAAADPVNVALTAVTGPLTFSVKTLGGVMLREALINSSIEAAQQPMVAQWYEELGIDYTFADFRNAILTAGAVGAGIPLVIRGGKTGIEIGKDFVPLSSDQIKKGYRAFIESGAAKESDVGRGAEMELLRQEDAFANNPLADVFSDLEHNRRLGNGSAAFQNNQAPRMSDKPESALKSPGSVYEADNLDGQIFKFNPDDIEVDAETFQFKAGGDEFGVTERLRDVTQWDPSKAGQVTVYEYADGRQFIADGHQRLGLAKRIKSQDPSQDVRLYGNKLRETDGITPVEARVIAAMKNISEGTGSVLDAAKVFRFSPERINDPSFPKGSEFVKQARALSNLAPENFGMAINEVVPSNFAAVVGRLIPDDANMQTAALNVLAKTEPANAFQAESVVRQVIDSGVTRESQQSLFGEEVVTESLFLERAKVLDRAQKQLRKDKSSFKNLVDNAARIEGEGNQLAKDANQKRANQDGTAIALLQSQANRKGPLSDALTDAAKLAKDQGSYTEATKRFVDAVRRSVDEGDFDRAEAGNAGRPFDVTEEAPTVRDDAEQLRLDDFSEPVGKGTIDQTNALTEDLRADLSEPNLLREDLKRLVESGGSEADIISHPAVVRAVDEMESLPRTSDMQGYGSEGWFTSRQYVVGSRRDGTFEEAFDHLREGARQLGWVDDKLEYPVGSLRRERKAVIVLGPPAAGKSTIANPIARKMGAAIVDSDEAKKILPEYRGGIGANAVHEESSFLADLLFKDLMEDGDNLVIPKVGGKVDSIERTIAKLREKGYEVDVIDMKVGAEEALRRMIGRFISKGRLINPEYVRDVGDNPGKTYDTIKKRGLADGYARIDNEGGPDVSRPILEDTRGTLEGFEIELRRGGGESDDVIGQPSGSELITARAQQSEEIEIPQIEESLLDTEFPIAQTLDGDENVVAQTMTARQILSDIDADTAMIDRLSRCPI